jgi:transaldolase
LEEFVKIFLDTADLEHIKFFESFIDGVTTNPSIMSKYGASMHTRIIKDICNMVTGHVSVEVISEKYDEMMIEGRAIASIHEQVCVKLPCTYDGLRVCKSLSGDGISTNLTLCFSPTQAILAAKCGATYVSPFIGRLEDIGHDGMQLIKEITEIYREHSYATKVISASVRSVQHVVESALLGADVVTVSEKILRCCINHPLTAEGLKIFANDWKHKK